MNEIDSGPSISGEILDGNRVVKLVYMDEAGISNSEQEPYAVVSGVVVDADKKLIAVERYLDTLVKRYIPEEHQDGFVFHAKELFNGGGKVFRRDDPRFPLSKRLEIAEALVDIPRRFGLPLAFGFVDRNNFPTSPEIGELSRRESARAAHLVAFVSAAMQVEMWMRQNAPKEVCLLVVENNDEARRLLTEHQNIYQNESNLLKAFGGTMTEEERSYFPYRKIKQSPLFEPKTPSSTLALADFCAYVFKKWCMKNPHYDKFFNQIEPNFVVHSMNLPKA